jgi:exodeoxyribonuclease-3
MSPGEWQAGGEGLVLRYGFAPSPFGEALAVLTDRGLAGLGWVDVGRAAVGEVPGPYTWWSWRGQAFDTDAGWRIDYQLATPALAAVASNYTVDRAPAYDQRWSDHTPVVVDYAL